MKISRSDARRLALEAVESSASILQGILTVGPEGVQIDGTDILEWLARHHDSEVILIAASIGQKPIESQWKTCYTCGREYKGDECSHCADARARLRGR